MKLKYWLILCSVLGISIACESNDCSAGGDAFPSFPIYFNFELSNGQDLFVGSDQYTFNNLKFVSSAVSINDTDTTRLSRDNVNYYGIDWLLFKDRDETEFYFDFGNGDTDTIRIENGSALDSFSEDLNCAEGIVLFYYNSRHIQTWDFDTDDQLSRQVIVNADFPEPENPYSVSIAKDI